VLVHHADARPHGVAGAAEALHDVVQQDVALVGLVQAVENVHQGGLSRAVLTQEGVDLARFYGEIDVVVGDEGTEFLRDAAKFELHGFRFYGGGNGSVTASGLSGRREPAEAGPLRDARLTTPRGKK
jgi:stage V sporulation protein SpoVS